MNPFVLMLAVLAIPSALLFVANARREKRENGTWRATRREVVVTAVCGLLTVALASTM